MNNVPPNISVQAAGSLPMPATAKPGRQTMPRRSPWLLWGGGTATVLALAAGVVVFLANQRGEEIARRRAEHAEQQAAGKLVQAFRDSKGVLAMKDGSRRELAGETSVLLITKPVAGEAATWLALGRTAHGVYFGQRFSMGVSGAVRAVTDAQEVSSDVALGELRARIAASGAEDQAAQVFLEAARTGEPVAVGR